MKQNRFEACRILKRIAFFSWRFLKAEIHVVDYKSSSLVFDEVQIPCQIILRSDWTICSSL